MGVGKEELKKEYSRMLQCIYDEGKDRGIKIGIVEGIKMISSKMNFSIDQVRNKLGIEEKDWELYLNAENEEKSEKKLNKEIFEEKCNMDKAVYHLISTEVYCIHKLILKYDMETEYAMNLLETPRWARKFYPRFIFNDVCGYMESYYIGYTESRSKICPEEETTVEQALKDFIAGNLILNTLAKRLKILSLRQNLSLEQAMDVFAIPEIYKEEVAKRIE